MNNLKELYNKPRVYFDVIAKLYVALKWYNVNLKNPSKFTKEEISKQSKDVEESLEETYNMLKKIYE